MDKPDSSLKKSLVRGCSSIVGVVLMLMVLLTVTDVTLRRVFNSPLAYSFELSGIGLVIVIISSLLYATTLERHIGIDLIVRRLPRRGRTILDTVTDFPVVILLGIIAWGCFFWAMDAWRQGYVTDILRIPYFPFLFLVALSSTLASLALLVKLVNIIIGEVKK